MDKLKPKQDSQSLYMLYFWQHYSWLWNFINQGAKSSQIQELHCYFRNKFLPWLLSEIKILELKCNREMLILLKQRRPLKAYLC